MKDYFWKAQDAENKRKYKKAFKYYLKGDELGDLGCTLNAGYCFYCGQGVKRNLGKAIEYYSKCVDGGYAVGASNLGMLYLERNDLERAKEYLLKAIAMGDKSAAVDIANIYNKEGNFIDAKYFYEMVLNFEPGTIMEAAIEEAQEKLKELANRCNNII